MEPKELESQVMGALEQVGAVAELGQRLLERLEALEEENRQLRARLEALELRQRLRPVGGVHVGIVQGSKAGEPAATDSLGRVKIRLAWDGRSKDVMAKVAVVWMGNSAAVQWLPRVGQAVYVAFEEGDPARPVVVGCVPNPTNPLPYDPVSATKSPTAAVVKDDSGATYRPQSANKYKNLWRTATADGKKINEIALVDDPENHGISLATDGSLLISAKGDEYRNTQGSRVQYVGGNSFLQVNGETTEIYHGKRKVVSLGEEENEHHEHKAEWHWGDVEEAFLGARVEAVLGAEVEARLQGGVGVKAGAFGEVFAGELAEAFLGAKEGLFAGWGLEASFGSETKVINGTEQIFIEGAESRVINGAEAIIVNGIAAEVVNGLKQIDATVKTEEGEITTEAVSVHTGEFSVVSEEKAMEMLDTAVSLINSGLKIIE